MDDASADDPFGPEVVAAVARHMNEDHAADNVLICRRAGAPPDTVAARLVGMGPEGAEFEIELAAHTTERLVVPWGTVPRSRADIRQEFVAMCAPDAP